MKYFGQYEDEIYAAGLRGVVPKLPIDIAALEKKAVAAWPDTIASYVQRDGIVHVLRCLLAEADLLMAIDGYPTMADLRSAALLRS